VLFNTAASAIVPLVLAAYGGQVATDPMADPRIRRNVKLVFWALALIGIVLAFCQQFKTALSDQDRDIKTAWFEGRLFHELSANQKQQLPTFWAVKSNDHPLRSSVSPPAMIVNAPGGAASIGQRGGITAGTLNQINPPFDPTVPVITYLLDGSIRTSSNGRIELNSGGTPERAAYRKMIELGTSMKWTELLSLSEEQMRLSPKWITSYYYAGIAQAASDHLDEGQRLLEYVEQQTKNNKDYGDLSQKARAAISQIVELKQRR
jgi:hypothetical protein